MTRTELFDVPESWIQSELLHDSYNSCDKIDFFLISRRYFNQLDTTSNVTFRHEINSTGNTYLFANNAVAASLWKMCEQGEYSGDVV